ncbi:AraC-type DNA-binding protein [Pedobacter hartonius]|uniref:AraC-type DNA-binding protein n=2 Tax=Pedobacter hartonius TaxID=425514 RepID=A0A1H4FU04_9SPHI|nr:AraC-type DNA-binding protein [Pedobacter hartonius]
MSLHGVKFIDYELHRDDHYMFIIQESGYFVFEVDFHTIEINDAGICYVAPGQVHRYIKTDQCEGWLLFVDSNYISKQFREAFDTMLNITQNTDLDKKDPVFAFAGHLGIWWLGEKGNDDLMSSVIKSLLDAISGLIASKLLGASTKFKRINSPKYILATRFRQLIKEHFLKLKQVKAYASLLHITPLYLNEVMKEITGFPASYWIQQEIILEGKRLLSYSGKDIREIAWELGYEDQAYFSRFFKNNTGVTASAFREQKP